MASRRKQQEIRRLQREKGITYSEATKERQVNSEDEMVRHFIKHSDQNCQKCKRGMEIWTARKAEK